MSLSSWNQQNHEQECKTGTTATDSSSESDSSLSASFESLWTTIEEAKVRIANGASSVAESRVFVQLLNEEVYRVTSSIEHEEKMQERFAKSLLREIASSRVDSLSHFRLQAQDIKNSSLNLRNVVDKNKAALE
eukprot:scaffold15719_cov114-Cylindrotheca_fusiformis.AAC.1